MVTSSELFSRMNDEPFEPFRIVTKAGESYFVLRNGWIFVGLNTIEVARVHTPDAVDFNQMDRVSISEVAAIEPLTEQKATKSNTKS